MRTFFTPLLPAILLLLLATALFGRAETGRPNFILILTDDQAWNGSAAMMDPEYEHSKSDYYETPSIERLAGAGMRFTDGYSPAPICTPTRRSIQYGMTPARQKGSEFRSPFEPEKHVSIAQMLKRIDPAYRTAHFGKWGSQMGIDPAAAGYDAGDGPTDNWVGGMEWGHPLTTQLFRALDDPKRAFSITDRAIGFMEETVSMGRPFFLQVSHYAVHLDMECLSGTWEKYYDKPLGRYHKIDAFAAMTEDMDTAVGQLLDAVERLGVDDETYIFFTSDNGGIITEPERNFPLHEGKGSLYEGGLRVPLIVTGPGIEAGVFNATPVVGWDLYATIAELADGAPLELPYEIDSVSFAGLLRGGEPGPRLVDRALVFHAPFHPQHKMSVIRQGDHKFVRVWATTGSDEEGTALFDLAADIGESRDLSGERPGRTRELEATMMNYLKAVDARMPNFRN